jgi:hypothetical protein
LERFVARPDRAKILGLALVSLVFSLLSLWVAGAWGEAPRSGPTWIGWPGAILFAVFAIGWSLRLRERADQIVVDAQGLTWRAYSEEHIPWSAVEAIERRSIRRQIFFAVYLKDPGAHPPTRLLGKVAAAQGGMGMGHFAINATGTDRSAAELEEALETFWHAER